MSRPFAGNLDRGTQPVYGEVTSSQLGCAQLSLACGQGFRPCGMEELLRLGREAGLKVDEVTNCLRLGRPLSDQLGSEQRSRSTKP